MPTTYRAYIRTFDGQVSEKTITTDREAAESAFVALVSRSDLDGKKLAAALTCNNGQLAFHRFDRNPGDADYWRDKVDQIEWPMGRPTEMEGGKAVKVYLDAPSRAIAIKLGNGNVSEGIRKALQRSSE